MHMKRALRQDADTRPIPRYCLRHVRNHPQKVRALKPCTLNYRIIKGLPRGLTPSGFQIKTKQMFLLLPAHISPYFTPTNVKW
jgi:hypothetical protein